MIGNEEVESGGTVEEGLSERIRHRTGLVDGTSRR